MNRKLLLRLVALLALVACAIAPSSAQKRHTFEASDGCFRLDGKPFVVKAAELHYPRIPRPYWKHRLQMVKSLGMNTVCLYVFWNLHEPEPGKFDFQGNSDVAEFCRMAQAEGLWVILRPGPYVCAEWEMGGLPWWLLRHDGVTLRSDDDPYFLERVAIFEKRVGQELADLTIERGGPIIMVQVENEYGSYAEDKAYVSKVRDIVRASGFDKVTLFQCDWASNFTLNGLDDLVWTMNFGTGANVDDQFRRLRELRPNSPLMCSEYWSGWFDKWGARHETRPSDKMTRGIGQMLSKGISFSLYMTHGGTSFGHWAGANSPGFAPDVTSYDYDAPIDEQGRPTKKFYELRDTLRAHSQGAKFPKVPKPIAVAKFDTVSVNLRYAPIAAGIDTVFKSDKPLTFEQMNMGWGLAIYKTKAPRVDADAIIEIDDLRDYASVYVDGELRGRADRVVRKRTVSLGSLREGQEITIVVEAMGRINFGRAIEDRKGITNAVRVTGSNGKHKVTYELGDWEIATVPDGYEVAQRALASAQASAAPANGAPGYYRGSFRMSKAADTYLDLRHWGKGQVWVNGHAIGRHWAIGPQQTLYLPGCWLRKGDNEIVILDVVGPRRAIVWGAAEPEINMLQPDAIPDVEKRVAPLTKCEWDRKLGTVKWQKADVDPKAGKRDIAMPKSASRYLVLRVDGCADAVAIAELWAVGADGKQLPREEWAVAFVSSEEMTAGNNDATKAFDLQESTAWKPKAGAKGPHYIIVDLGKSYDVAGIQLLPSGYAGAGNMKVSVGTLAK